MTIVVIQRVKGGEMVGKLLRVSVLASVLVVFVANPGKSAESRDLRALIRATQSIDLRAADHKKERARIEALVEAARGHKSVPLEDWFLARKTLVSLTFYQGKAQQALEEIDQLLVDIGRSPLAGGDIDMEIRGNRAALLGLLGRNSDALAEMKRIQAYFLNVRGKHNDSYIATTAEIGAIQYSMGDPLAAEAASREAVELARQTPSVDDSALIRYWQNWATLLHNTGHTAEGLRELQEVARFAEQKLGAKHVLTNNVVRNLATELNNAGRYNEAEVVGRHALEISRQVEGETNPRLAYALNTLGYALLGAKGPAQALPMFDAALEHAQRYPDTGVPHLTGELMLNVAQAHEALGQDAEAMKWRLRAVEEMKRAVGESHATYGRANADLGASLLRSGQTAEALKHIQVASIIFERLQKPRSKLRIQNQVLEGVAMQRLGDASGYERAAAAIAIGREAVMEDLTTPAQTLRNAAQFAAAFADFSELAMATGHVESAFEAMQLAQLGELDSAGAALLAREAGESTGIGPRLRELQDLGAKLSKLRTTRSASIAGGDAAALATTDAEIARLETSIAQLSTEIHRAFPAYSRLIRPEPEPLARVQSRLKQGDALLLVQQGRTGVLAMLVKAGSVRTANTPAARTLVPSLVARVRQSIEDAQLAGTEEVTFDADAAWRLHALVLPKALDRSASRKRNLYVLPSGPLASLPFSLLITEQPAQAQVSGSALRKLAWLVKRQAVGTPTTLSMLGQPRKARAQGRFAGIGAPSLRGQGEVQVAMRGLTRSGSLMTEDVDTLPPLPGSETELRELGDAFGGGEVLLLTGSSATRERVLATDFNSFEVIAFATHGLVSGELRGLTEPALVLTPVRGKLGSGILTASDVAGLKLNADWVILSACNTSAADHPGAPMYSGLARAFVFAGARSLLLSHWRVRDDVASRLTVDTVMRARTGSSRTQALREAQLRLMKDTTLPGAAHPAAWAPFVIIGD